MQQQRIYTFLIFKQLFQPFPVAIVVPDPDVIPGWAKPRGLPTTMVEFCKNDVAKQEILKDMNRVGKEAGLKGFEFVSIFPCDSQKKFTCCVILRLLIPVTDVIVKLCSRVI